MRRSQINHTLIILTGVQLIQTHYSGYTLLATAAILSNLEPADQNYKLSIIKMHLIHHFIYKPLHNRW